MHPKPSTQTPEVISGGSLGNIEAWKVANDNENGRNACVIEASTNYYYFKKIFPLVYDWTVVPKSEW